MGATIQQTRYSKGRVLQDASRAEGEVVSGLNLLTNNQVRVSHVGGLGRR
jgi:hypothetical protein